MDPVTKGVINMIVRCCICGKKIADDEECFELNERYGNECICVDCGDCLHKVKTMSDKGDPSFREYRKQLVRQLERGHASENGAAYCEQFIVKANARFKQIYGEKEPRLETSPKTDATITGQTGTPVSATPYQQPTNTLFAGSPSAATVPIAQNAQSATPQSDKNSISTAVTTHENVICKNCGSENHYDSAFCETCGAPLKPQKFCRFCGGRVSPVTGHCETCGRDPSGAIAKQNAGPTISQVFDKVGGQIKKATNDLRVSNTTAVSFFNPFILHIALILVLAALFFGEIIEMPSAYRITSNSRSTSLSMWQISDTVAFMKENFSNLKDKTDILSVTSGAAIFAAAFALILLAISLINAFLDKQSSFSNLWTGSLLSTIAYGLAIISIILENSLIDEFSDGWISRIVQAKPSLYFAFVLSLVTVLFLARFFECLYVVYLQKKGQLAKAELILEDLSVNMRTIVQKLTR